MGQVKHLPALIYAGARQVGPYNQVGPGFDRVMRWAEANGVFGPATMVLGLSWDSPVLVAADKLRYDAAVTVRRRLPVPDGISISALPAMDWFMGVHRGPYAGMTDSFMKLWGELERRDDLVPVEFCGLEIYRSPPGTPEADLVTEIGYAVVRSES